jgi:hypothetical protein
MKQLSEKDSKRIAQLWAEQYGKSLTAEAEVMRQQEVYYHTPRADQTVQKIAAHSPELKKRRRTNRRNRATIYATLAAAACLVLVALLAGVPSLVSLVSPPSSSPGDAEQNPAGPTADAEILPINFTLPADYRVAAKDYDNGVSLYALESQRYGDVVLTMCPASEQLAGSAGAAGNATTLIDEVIIDGTAVPARVDDAFMLLAFEHRDVHYTLSSHDNLGALVALYRNIVGVSK